MIANKYDSILKRNLTNAERMLDTQATIEFMYRILNTLKFKVLHIADDLPEEKLHVIEEAVKIASNALDNAAFLGDLGYTGKDVYPVMWEKDESKHSNVYLVTNEDGEMYEENILGVFSSRDKAEDYARKIAGKFAYDCDLRPKITFAPNTDDIVCISFFGDHDYHFTSLQIVPWKLDTGIRLN